MKHLKNLGFLAALVGAVILLDCLLAAFFQPYVVSSGRFYYNDFEITCRDHPEEVWDQVFFGNSVVISAFREDVTQSDFINLGVDYGVVRDLWEMMDKGTIRVGSQLVIGLSDLTLYDKFETNPAYLWHRGALEPYAYFRRDDVRRALELWAKELLGQEMPDWSGQQKAHYSGSLSAGELDGKVAASKYVGLPIEDFQQNMACLQKLADRCREEGIRLRCVWMPVNPRVARQSQNRAVYDQAKNICLKNGVEFLDLEQALPESCFYDIGHLNWEYGAYKFTEVIDPWLQK